MHFLQIIVLAFVQGFAELLPVSSSAHVIVAEHLMGLDPSAPEMTFLLVMLHTGTMGAVLFYFWKRWKELLLNDRANQYNFIKTLFIATVLTGIFGLTLKFIIEKFFMSGSSKGEIEELFGNLTLISVSLFVVGILILIAGRRKQTPNDMARANPMTNQKASIIGIVQGICLPFRGFSRSGATISVGLLVGVSRSLAEEFSFALAVILTPPVVAKELLRLTKSPEFHGMVSSGNAASVFTPGLLGMVFSFFAGLIALKWVSSWIEKGRWAWFGYYCLAASVAIYFIGR
jgi:undecaprenyl-diphosphatase